MDIIVERHRFYERCQRSNETFIQFLKDVRRLARSCHFDIQEEWLIRDRLVFGVRNVDVRRRILSCGGNPTLQHIINTCKYAEETAEQNHNDAEDSASKNELKNEDVFEEWLMESQSDQAEEVSLKIELIQPEDFYEHVDLYNDELYSESVEQQEILEQCNIFEKKEDNFCCYLCHKNFANLSEITVHMKHHAVEENELTDTSNVDLNIEDSQLEANHRSSSESNLSNLTQEDHEPSPLPQPAADVNFRFSCTVCSSRFQHNTALKAHLLSHGEENLFQCSYCQQLFTTPMYLKRHTLNKHEKRFKCSFCDKLFGRRTELNIHCVSKHKPHGSTCACKVCEDTFRPTNYLNEKDSDNQNQTASEALSSNDKDRRRFACTFCDQIFPNYPVLKRHLRLHSDNSLKCHICDEFFSKLAYLKRHVQNIHKKPFHCDECGKKFARRRELDHHVVKHGKTKGAEQSSLLNTSIKIKVCSECDLEFSCTSELTEHINQTHPRQYLCYICNKEFLRFRNVKRHMVQHCQENHCLCNVCGRKLRSAQALKFHIMSHSGERPFNCSICNNRFRRAGDLKSHMIRHTGNKPFQCDLCEKRFGVAYQLKLHKMIHNDERPFKCETCSKCFRTASNLKEHILAHTGVKRHVCQKCNKHYRKKGNLKAHEKLCTRALGTNISTVNLVNLVKS